MDGACSTYESESDMHAEFESETRTDEGTWKDNLECLQDVAEWIILS